MKFLVQALKANEGELLKLQRDWERRFRKYPGKNFRWQLDYYWSNIQYRTILLYRLSCAFRGVRFFGWYFERGYRKASIASGLEFFCSPGGGMIIPHFGPIKLNATSIGEDLYIFHNVTIGNDYTTGKPTIGNNVFISTHSVVMGKITIGDNVIIGANSLVMSDVPSNCMVAGSPAKLIRTLEPDAVQKMIGY